MKKVNYQFEAFEPKTEVWILHKDKAVKGIITDVRFTANDKPKVEYTIRIEQNGVDYRFELEEKLFSSREDLINSL